MKAESDNSNIIPGTDPDVIAGVFKDIGDATHNSHWEELASSDPAFVRAALTQAQRIRDAVTDGAEIDAGDAYLMGTAARYAATERQALIDGFMANFSPEDLLSGSAN